MKGADDNTMFVADLLYCRFLNPAIVTLQFPPLLEAAEVFGDGRPHSYDTGYEHSLEHLEALYHALYSDLPL